MWKCMGDRWKTKNHRTLSLTGWRDLFSFICIILFSQMNAETNAYLRRQNLVVSYLTYFQPNVLTVSVRDTYFLCPVICLHGPPQGYSIDFYSVMWASLWKKADTEQRTTCGTNIIQCFHLWSFLTRKPDQYLHFVANRACWMKCRSSKQPQRAIVLPFRHSSLVSGLNFHGTDNLYSLPVLRNLYHSV